MKRILFAVCALISLPVLSGAQNETLGWACTEMDPVYTAMAGCHITSSHDISYSAFHNPAMIPLSERKMGVTVSYRAGIDAMAYGDISAGTGFKIGKHFGLALGANYKLGPEYEVIDDFGNRNGMFKTSALILSIGAGVRIIDNLSLGLNLKYLGEFLEPQDNPGAFACDAYLSYRWSWLTASAGVANVGTKVKDSAGQAFPLPSSAKLGIAYSYTFGPDHFVEASVNADIYFTGKTGIALGTQYGWKDMLFIRAGYRYATQACPVPGYASVGLGCRLKGFRIDLAYLFTGSLNNTIGLALGYSF